jgi:hypothetical protein
MKNTADQKLFKNNEMQRFNGKIWNVKSKVNFKYVNEFGTWFIFSKYLISAVYESLNFKSN